MLGKGAAAAAAPKGAIAKVLTNLEPTKIDAGKAIIEFFNARNAYEGSAELVNKYQFATNAISNFLLVLKQHNIDPGTGITNLQNDLQRNIGINNVVIGFLNGKISQDEGKQLLKKYNMSHMFDYEEHFLMDTLEDDLVGYADYFDTLSDEVDEAVGEMFKKDLISPEAQKILEQDYEKYKCDYVKDPASKARKDKFEKERKESLERDLERYEYNRTARDIDYSRMDKAGGAEDEGYAKYYEKVNTFDSLLSFITEEDDAFAGLEVVGDAMLPEGKIVYGIERYSEEGINTSMTLTKGKKQLPPKAQFLCKDVFYTQNPNSAMSNLILYYTSPKVAKIMKKIYPHRMVSNPVTEEEEKIIDEIQTRIEGFFADFFGDPEEEWGV